MVNGNDDPPRDRSRLHIAAVLPQCANAAKEPNLLDVLKGAAKRLNATVTHIPFEALDVSKRQETFHGAGVAVVDISEAQQRADLSYHLGVRESGLNHHAVVLIHNTDPDTTEALKSLYSSHIFIPYVTERGEICFSKLGNGDATLDEDFASATEEFAAANDDVTAMAETSVPAESSIPAESSVPVESSIPAKSS
eukprot:scpid100184/ scgid32824/ Mitogen-activated protein kinase kinase kinase 15; Apoptosis signal-regulating kinase 3; MAPK/ERK kinase kinase 15